MVATNNARFDLSPVVSTDEYLVVLVNTGRFDRLLRKDDLLDEGVAAVFGLTGAEAELLGLCFHAGRFTPIQVAAWLAERRFPPPADAPALAALIAEGLRSNAPETVAPRTRALRARFQGLHYVTP